MSNINLMPFQGLTRKFYELIKADWMANDDYIGDYIQDDVLALEKSQVQAYKDATKELHKILTDAAQHVIDNNLYDELHINPLMIEMIEHTWKRHPHLYGRFDIAGGIGIRPIKLIEFNSDNPGLLVETGLVQRAHAIENKLDSDQQWNEVLEYMVEYFAKLLENNPDKHPDLLLTYMDYDEDQTTTEFIAHAAKIAGFEKIDYAYLPEITFSDDEEEGGVWVEKGDCEYVRYDFWFKHIPWEWLCEDEPELIKILTNIVKQDQCVVLNPAYSLLYQSKAIYKILWDLYPNHPLLLKTTNSADDFEGKMYVEKPVFGRAGQNVIIYDEKGEKYDWEDGPYGDQPKVYQEYFEQPYDDEDRFYQAGIFYTNGASGIGFRRSDGMEAEEIIQEDGQFISHFIIKEFLEDED